MKFIVSSSQLLKQLQSISGVLNSSNTLPILDNFLFEVKSNELIVSASDLETTMTAQINNTEASEEGNIAIPAKLLMDTLKTFSEQPLTFLVDKNTHGIEIGSDNGKYKLAGQNGEEFPAVPSMENASSTTLPSYILAKAINKTLFATGNDELRPIMSGQSYIFFGKRREIGIMTPLEQTHLFHGVPNPNRIEILRSRILIISSASRRTSPFPTTSRRPYHTHDKNTKRHHGHLMAITRAKGTTQRHRRQDVRTQ